MRLIIAALLGASVLNPVLAASKKDVDASDSVRALVHPGSATRKVETANRKTAIAFWQSITQDQNSNAASQMLSPDFVNHAPGLASGGQAFIDALRTREQGWKLAASAKPLFALSTGSLVMIAEGTDAKDPQTGFHSVVLRITGGKIAEFWADGP